jgi:hypothetical protein
MRLIKFGKTLKLMRTPLTYLLLLAFSSSAFAQITIDDELLAGPEWFEGSLLLNSGKEYKGLIKYNDKTDIVCLENARESKSFTARHVKGFEFFDEVEQKQRVFYSVEVEDKINNIRRPLFFEVLVDSRDFALLSKIAPIRMERREYAVPAMFNPATGSFTSGRYYGYPSTISQTETLFLFSKEGEIRPLLEIKEKEIDGMFHDRSVVKNRLLDDDVLKRFTRSHYSKLVSYAKENSLSIKEKNDLITLLHYYNSIRN